MQGNTIKTEYLMCMEKYQLKLKVYSKSMKPYKESKNLDKCVFS